MTASLMLSTTVQQWFGGRDISRQGDEPSFFVSLPVMGSCLSGLFKKP
ncbi:MAG: hypothetical protein R6V25_13115 [Desulfatiglandales bacterium]